VNRCSPLTAAIVVLAVWLALAAAGVAVVYTLYTILWRMR